MNKYATDVSFELFNYCNGSCTGCMLSSLDRKYELATSLEDISVALRKLDAYGKKHNVTYRPVFSFGDTFKLKEETLFGVFNICKELDMPFGTTVTCVDVDFADKYTEIAKRIRDNYDVSIIDITIDPFRLKNLNKREQYIKNLLNVMNNSQKLHLQVLLSEAVMNKFTPKDLYECLAILGDKYTFFLAFSPTKENLNQIGFKYEVTNAYKYVNDFYSVNETMAKFRKQELKRFDNQGKYSDFAKHVFHIDHSFNVYPVNYSVFGDVIRDKRNKLDSLGNLLQDDLENIVTPLKLKKLDILNDLSMDDSPYNCTDCDWFEACTYSGIGLIREVYKEYEFRVGHCYGPGFEKN
jgi:hypothetical protein